MKRLVNAVKNKIPTVAGGKAKKTGASPKKKSLNQLSEAETLGVAGGVNVGDANPPTR